MVCGSWDGPRVEGASIRTCPKLSDLRLARLPEAGYHRASAAEGPDFRDVPGCEAAKRALQVAAAGGHGVLMVGPSGAGKAELASRLPSILPPMTEAEAFEAAAIHSAVGEATEPILTGMRPFRSPHHSIALPGLVGGGSPLHPGEASLAHNGVLFLDGIADFKPSALQGIRQSLESGRVAITRVGVGRVELPSRFMLAAAADPCPCGCYGDGDEPCTCSSGLIRAYRSRIGGPLTDRIDVRVDVSRTAFREVAASVRGTGSDELRLGVLRAREFAAWRLARSGEERPRTPEAIARSCALSEQDEGFLEGTARTLGAGGRGILRVLSVARTIADMQQSERVGREHLVEALALAFRG